MLNSGARVKYIAYTIAYKILQKNEPMKKISKTNSVREIRQKLELTQEQFAHRIGVSFSTVNRWENGKGDPSPLAMRAILGLQEESQKK